MKAIVYENSRARLVERPIPKPGPGEIVIQVEACGLCGTDLMKLATKPETAILGHELCGTISALGAGVSGWNLGDRLVAAHHVPCLKCHYCQRGSISKCRQFKETNIEPGGFSEYVLLSKLHVNGSVFKISASLEAKLACQTEPLACCLRSIKRLDLKSGDVAGIIGLGAVGQMMARLLRHHFSVDVLGIDLDPKRAALLAGSGKGFTDPLKMEEALAQASSKRGLDALIVTAGTAELVVEKLRWLRDGGKLNLFSGFHPEGRATIDFNDLYDRELSIIQSYSPSPEDLRESLELIASKKVPLAEIESTTYSLDQFDQAANDIRARKTLKAIFVPGVRSSHYTKF
jgi:L-iditol 2-dehydrogenase